VNFTALRKREQLYDKLLQHLGRGVRGETRGDQELRFDGRAE